MKCGVVYLHVLFLHTKSSNKFLEPVLLCVAVKHVNTLPLEHKIS